MAQILVIDDSRFLRHLVCNWLLEGGHQVTEAENGADGLVMIASHSPDCILLDLAMPRLDGLEVLEDLRAHGCTIPVIVVTADVQETTSQQCLDLGARAVMNKPSSPKELNEAVSNVLAANVGADK